MAQDGLDRRIPGNQFGQTKVNALLGTSQGVAMDVREAYATLKRRIEDSGYHAQLREDLAGDVLGIVCASNVNEHGDPCGNSFWLIFSRGVWTIMCWGDDILYALDEKSDPLAIVSVLLASANSPIAEIDEAFLRKYRLTCHRQRWENSEEPP